jgi:hypothetical protein
VEAGKPVGGERDLDEPPRELGPRPAGDTDDDLLARHGEESIRRTDKQFDR